MDRLFSVFFSDLCEDSRVRYVNIVSDDSRLRLLDLSADNLTLKKDGFNDLRVLFKEGESELTMKYRLSYDGFSYTDYHNITFVAPDVRNEECSYPESMIRLLSFDEDVESIYLMFLESGVITQGEYPYIIPIVQYYRDAPDATEAFLQNLRLSSEDRGIRLYKVSEGIPSLMDKDTALSEGDKVYALSRKRDEFVPYMAITYKSKDNFIEEIELLNFASGNFSFIEIWDEWYRANFNS